MYNWKVDSHTELFQAFKIPIKQIKYPLINLN